MTDRERLAAAREFFWSVMDRFDQAPIAFGVAERQIAKLASCLPPFTSLSTARAPSS